MAEGKKGKKKPAEKKEKVKKEKAAAEKKPKKPEPKKEKAKPVGKVKKKAAEKKKPEKKQKKPAKKKPKSKEIKVLAAKVKKKKRVLFRGRFGSRSVRKKSKKKWQKWRKPRGIDIYRQQEDGAYPKTGYRTSKEIRGVHPSGYRVVLVRNEREMQQMEGRKDSAALLAATLGKRKRRLLLEKAEKLGITVLNG